MLLTLGDHNPDMITMATKYQTLVYQADAFFHTADYKKAEVNISLLRKRIFLALNIV